MDTWVYPIVFLYRHQVELMLKAITLTSTSILGPTKEYPRGHNLSKLWKGIRPLLNRVCREVQHEVFPEEDLEGIDEYISPLASPSQDYLLLKTYPISIMLQHWSSRLTRQTSKSRF